VENQVLDWFERRRERQRELARGVDADLVLDTRRRRYKGWSLVGCGLLILFALRFARLPERLAQAGGIAAVLFMIVGGLLTSWADAEQKWLNRPDPKDPPSILKGK